MNFIDPGTKFAVEPSVVAGAKLKANSIQIFDIDIQSKTASLDKQFSFVSMFDVLEHLFFPDTALKNCSRLLEKNGFMVATVPNDVLNIKHIAKLLFRRTEASVFTYNNNGHIRFFSQETFEKMFKDCGFEVMISTGYGRLGWLARTWPNIFAYGYIIVAKKITT